MRKRKATFRRLGAACGIAVLLAMSGPASAQNDEVERGRYLFTEGYKCYACHGFDAQSGARRLVPLNYTLPGFTALVHNSPFQQMPSFNDVPDEDLAALFAYIRTIPVDAPALEEIPLLRDIADRKREALDQSD